MTFEDLHEAGNEMAVKAAGKYRQQGKEYVVGDGDVICALSSLIDVLQCNR